MKINISSLKRGVVTAIFGAAMLIGLGATTYAQGGYGYDPYYNGGQRDSYYGTQNGSHRKQEKRADKRHQKAEKRDLKRHQRDERDYYGNDRDLREHQREESRAVKRHQRNEKQDRKRHQRNERRGYDNGGYYNDRYDNRRNDDHDH